MDVLPAAFDALASVSQFVVYVTRHSTSRPGKTDKIPVDRDGNMANAHDPRIWMAAADAIAAAARLGKHHGVGFVFTGNDPFFFIDIDNCWDGKQWSPLAISLLTRFAGAAVEVSQSGYGLHIIGSGKSPPHACRNSALGIEFYTEGRFVALTGIHASGSAGFDATHLLPAFVDEYFPLSGGDEIHSEWTSEPCADWNGSTDDTELIRRALQSQSAASIFGDGVTFRDLWEARADILSKRWPSSEPPGYDESAADAALAQRLAFWTGRNCERIRRLMWMSALNREKWNREDYLPRTISGVCGRQKDVLCDKQPQFSTNLTPGQVRAQRVDGATFLDLGQQEEVFAGCVYVLDEHKIMVPGGHLLTSDRFRALYGGYSMVMDKANERVTRNAFEAFTESQGLRHPKVTTSCFRPDLAPGTIVQGAGETSVNIYYPVQTPRLQGDITPFLVHVEKLFPVPKDQAIILAYLAALIQHKGVKFQWAPLIQGVEGNGKTFFTRCIAFAIGQRHSHFPKAAEIAGKFNGWLYGKIFVGVEDIYLHDNRFEVMETLKPMITNERQEIEAKGADKVIRDVCANFLINTNHKDGLTKTRNDRRFAPFYTSQQSLDDLRRDGMLGNYFSDLYHWASREGGYAIIAEYLERYEIPSDLNPATFCNRAPITSSTESAIEQGRGTIEQEIMEAIEEGVPGFRGGWVSSMALDRLLTHLQANRRIPRNRRQEIMESLGYIRHPGLTDGRVANMVLPDNGKPRLYIRTDHADRHLTGAAKIERAYAQAQK